MPPASDYDVVETVLRHSGNEYPTPPPWDEVAEQIVPWEPP